MLLYYITSPDALPYPPPPYLKRIMLTRQILERDHSEKGKLKKGSSGKGQV